MLFPRGCSTFEPFRLRSAWCSSRMVCSLQSAPKVDGSGLERIAVVVEELHWSKDVPGISLIYRIASHPIHFAVMLGDPATSVW